MKGVDSIFFVDHVKVKRTPPEKRYLNPRTVVAAGLEESRDSIIYSNYDLNTIQSQKHNQNKLNYWESVNYLNCKH